MSEQGKGKRIATWVVSGLLTLAFLGAGGSKLAGVPMHVENFARWGYPDWFRLLTGTIEVASAIALLVPKTSFYAASALVVTMLGATLTHLTHGEAPMILGPLLLGAMAAFVASARRPVRASAPTNAPAA